MGPIGAAIDSRNQSVAVLRNYRAGIGERQVLPFFLSRPSRSRRVWAPARGLELSPGTLLQIHSEPMARGRCERVFDTSRRRDAALEVAELSRVSQRSNPL